jgi:hypothetical protein
MSGIASSSLVTVTTSIVMLHASPPEALLVRVHGCVTRLCALFEQSALTTCVASKDCCSRTALSCRLQMFMGDTISRSLGQQSASKLMRSMQPGCIIDCVGRPALGELHQASRTDYAGGELRDRSHSSGSDACTEFVALSVQIVSPRAVSSRGNAMPLQLLSTLTIPLSRVQRIEGDVARLSKWK